MKTTYNFPGSAMAEVAAAIKPMTVDPIVAKALRMGLGPNKDGGFHIICEPGDVFAALVSTLHARLGNS
jgi:hypothetical protein